MNKQEVSITLRGLLYLAIILMGFYQFILYFKSQQYILATICVLAIARLMYVLFKLIHESKKENKE